MMPLKSHAEVGSDLFLAVALVLADCLPMTELPPEFIIDDALLQSGFTALVLVQDRRGAVDILLRDDLLHTAGQHRGGLLFRHFGYVRSVYHGTLVADDLVVLGFLSKEG